MHIRLATVVRFAPGKDQLERQTPVGHRGDRNSKGVNVLAVVTLVTVSKIFSDPALKIRNVAYKIHLAPG
jgi:hypothetical protein